MIPIILFGLAAGGGGGLLAMHLSGKKPPMLIGLIHGGVAAGGLLALILSLMNSTPSQLTIVSLILFLLAALGGFYLFSLRLRKLPMPKATLFVHAAVAVVAFLLLVKETLL